MTGSQRPALASDDWMLEQQVRAELEAEAWRRLRRDLAIPQAPAPVATPPAPTPAAPQPTPIVLDDPHSSGSTILKALVRFALAAFCGYIAYLAAVDSQLGEFEAWFAVGSTFMVMLALSMFDPIRRFVHMAAEAARWLILSAVGFGAVWIVFHLQT